MVRTPSRNGKANPKLRLASVSTLNLGPEV
jgi:hypothetical protein